MVFLSSEVLNDYYSDEIQIMSHFYYAPNLNKFLSISCTWDRSTFQVHGYIADPKSLNFVKLDYPWSLVQSVKGLICFAN